MLDLSKLSIEDLEKEIQKRKLIEKTLQEEKFNSEKEEKNKQILFAWNNVNNILNFLIDNEYYCDYFVYSTRDSSNNCKISSREELNQMNISIVSEVEDNYSKYNSYEIRLYKISKKGTDEYNDSCTFLNFIFGYSLNSLLNDCSSLNIKFGEMRCGSEEFTDDITLSHKEISSEKFILNSIYKNLMVLMDHHVHKINNYYFSIAMISEKIKSNKE